MRALLDVSCLLALMDEDHVHHQRAMAWWQTNEQHGWASSPLTQNGFIRVLAQTSYPGRQPVQIAIEQLQRQTSEPNHEFWPDDVSFLDPAYIDHRHVLGPKQITDMYLVALAVKNRGRLVTFDTAVAIAAVKGAGPQHLVAL